MKLVKATPKKLAVNMCEICQYAEIKKVETMALYPRPHKCEKLQILCKKTLNFKNKWVLLHECGDYRPKVGVYPKTNIEQTTLNNFDSFRPKKVINHGKTKNKQTKF